MRTYVFKLYKSKKNKQLHKAINVAGCIWNHLIALHKRYYSLYKKSLSSNKIKLHITKLKKTKKFSFWNNLGSQAIQDVAERIDRSYKLFFRNIKHGVKSSPPRFRKVKKYSSFTLKQAGWKLLQKNQIIIMGKEYKYFKSRDIFGEIKTVTIKRDKLGDLWLFFTVKENFDPIKVRSGKIVGLDFGLKTFLTTSKNDHLENPMFFMRTLKTIKSLSKSLSKKKKGSNNYEKARIKLAKAHRKVTNQRKDFHFKLALDLSRKYAAISVEDLNLKAMKRLWGRKVSDLGYYSFLEILSWECYKNGSQLIKIPRFYPSSKTCSNCGYIFEELSLKDRTWKCPKCGSNHDRDLNAAINIERVGASTLKVEDVRPTI